MNVLYAIVHATCGHAGAVSSDRAAMEQLADRLHGLGQHRWRVRVAQGVEGQEATVEGLLTSDPNAAGCGTCNLPPGVAAPAREVRR